MTTGATWRVGAPPAAVDTAIDWLGGSDVLDRVWWDSWETCWALLGDGWSTRVYARKVVPVFLSAGIVEESDATTRRRSSHWAHIRLASGVTLDHARRVAAALALEHGPEWQTA